MFNLYIKRKEMQQEYKNTKNKLIIREEVVLEELESNFSEIKSYFREQIKSEEKEKNLINAIESYLQQNYSELYNENNLEIVFQKAREDKNVELKMVNTISKFILN